MVLRKEFVLLMVSLLATPVWAAPSAAVGTVHGSNNAIVRGTTLVAGTTVYSGDTIQVGAHGNAWISLSQGGQVILSEGSRASLERGGTSAPVQLVVEKGFAKFTRNAAAPLEAVLGNATIRTAGAAGTGFVNVTGPDSAVIGAEKGSLTVTTPSGTTTVPEGMGMTVRLEDAQAQTSSAPASGQSGNHKAVVIGSVIALASIGVIAGVAASQSGTTGTVVSPYIPQ